MIDPKATDGHRGRRRPSTAIKLALSAGGILAGLLLAEGAARLWLYKFASRDQYRAYELIQNKQDRELRISKHPYIGYYPTPNYRDKKTSHNSLGYRGPEIPQPKPAGEFRVVCIGGSTTYSTGVDDDEKMFTAQLEKELGGEYGYRNIRVINAGVQGHTSWECLANLEFRVLDLTPDLVVMYEGVNDAHTRFIPPELYRGDNSGYRSAFKIPDPAWYERSVLFRVVARNRGWMSQKGVTEMAIQSGRYDDAYRLPVTPPGFEDPFVLLKKNPPVYFERNLRNMAAISRANGCNILFATFAYTTAFPDDYTALRHYQAAIAEHNEAMARVAREAQAPLFDFAKEMSRDEEYWYDGRHTNKKGDLLKARLFAAYLDETALIPAKFKQASSAPASSSAAE